MTTLDDFKEQIPLLVESGLIAIKQGDETSAKSIFDAVDALDPKSTFKKMGYGLIALHKMETEKAVQSFKQVLEIEPNNHRAQAFLGLAYVLTAVDETVTDKQMQMQNLEKGTNLASEVLEKADAESTKELARSVLDWEKQIEQKSSEAKGPWG